MKVVLYLDIYPWNKLDDYYSAYSMTAGEKPKDAKRYKIIVEVPDPEVEHDGLIPSNIVREE